MRHNNKSSARVIAAAVGIILLAGITTYPAMLSQTAIAGPTSDAEITATTTTTTTPGNAQEGIAVGGGNLTVAVNLFLPSTIDIQPGESVTFYALNGSTEIHNVVLDLSNGTAISSVELAFLLPSGVSPEAFQLAPPNNFGEPIIQNMSDGRQAIIALNKVLFHPSVVNQNGDVTYLQEQEFIQQIEQGVQQGLLMPPLSANYTMQGTERVVSSGLILDITGFEALQQQGAQQEGGAQGQQQQPPTPEAVVEFPPPAYPILSNFTVTFQEPGIYPFFCAFHPGMNGVVNVTEGGTTQNQTEA
jgi:plastocyanin